MASNAKLTGRKAALTFIRYHAAQIALHLLSEAFECLYIIAGFFW